jgi:hypothetical protein
MDGTRAGCGKADADLAAELRVPTGLNAASSSCLAWMNWM